MKVVLVLVALAVAVAVAGTHYTVIRWLIVNMNPSVSNIRSSPVCVNINISIGSLALFQIPSRGVIPQRMISMQLRTLWLIV